MLLLFIEAGTKFNCQIAAVVFEILIRMSLWLGCCICVPFIHKGCSEPIVHGVPFHSMTVLTATLKWPLLTMHLLVESIAATKSSVVIVKNWNRVWGLFSFLSGTAP